jgi:hypothetical protein
MEIAGGRADKNRRLCVKRLLTGGGALALLGLLVGAGAIALTPVRRERTALMAATGANQVQRVQPASTDLVPAGTVSSHLPTSSTEDIRNIRQPGHLSLRWLTAAVTAGIILLPGALLLGWRWLRRGRFFVMPPDEVALQYLEEARRLMDADHIGRYCVKVSRILRRYIEERYRIQAPHVATDTFLRQLLDAGEYLPVPQRVLLAEFLCHRTLAKSAGEHGRRADLEFMHSAAERFVRQSATHPGDRREKMRNPPADLPCPGEPSPGSRQTTAMDPD